METTIVEKGNYSQLREWGIEQVLQKGITGNGVVALNALYETIGNNKRQNDIDIDLQIVRRGILRKTYIEFMGKRLEDNDFKNWEEMTDNELLTELVTNMETTRVIRLMARLDKVQGNKIEKQETAPSPLDKLTQNVRVHITRIEIEL